MPITIYHNPRCSKSRQTLNLLEERELEIEVVRYLESPPTVDELTRILRQLGLQPREAMRRNEAPYAALKLDSSGLSEAELIQAMVENPILIERPIVVVGNEARIGRPPEAVLEIL